MTNEEAMKELWRIYQDIGVIANELYKQRVSTHTASLKLESRHERLGIVFYELRRNLDI
jgi:hypothetical protein